MAEALPVTEAENPATRDLDRVGAATAVRLLLGEEARTPAAVLEVAGDVARAATWLAEALAAGGRLVLVGSGTSGRLCAMEAAELVPTFGLAPERAVAIVAGGEGAFVRAVEGAEDDGNGAAQAVADLGVGPDDLLVGVTAGGRTPFVVAALREAGRRGARRVLVSAVPEGPAAAEADLVVAPRTGPEALTGSTRLKAGTAAKLVLNTMTTVAMALGGRLYGNRMVDVTPTNAKLRARACRLVAEVGGVDPTRAGALLADAGFEVKTAVLMARDGLDAAEARRRLAVVGGRLRDALAP